MPRGYEGEEHVIAWHFIDSDGNDGCMVFGNLVWLFYYLHIYLIFSWLGEGEGRGRGVCWRGKSVCSVEWGMILLKLKLMSGCF